MRRSTISVLGYALLGLVHHKPSSGYDLRKIFTDTAMGSYSDSPGAIYPALERLEERGLLEGKAEERAGLRRRKLYKLTNSGNRELKRWLARPITRGDVVRGMGELMLRFAFMEHAMGRKAAISFLRNLEDELQAYVPELKQYLQQHAAQMPLSGMLALDSGIRNYETLQQWAQYAIQTYQDAVTRKQIIRSRSNT